MSELVELMGFNYDDPRSREDWAFNNADDHDLIRQAIYSVGIPTANVTQWVLNPIDWNDWESFAIRHQSAHNEINSILGIAGSDLTTVDFKDPKQAEAWHQIHLMMHQSARAFFGI